MKQESTNPLKKKVAALPQGVLKVLATAYLDEPTGMTDKQLSSVVYASPCTIKRWRRILSKNHQAVFQSEKVNGIVKYTLIDLA